MKSFGGTVEESGVAIKQETDLILGEIACSNVYKKDQDLISIATAGIDAIEAHSSG